MTDYIKREDAKHAVWGCTRDTGIDEAPFEYAEGLLENVPSADVAPVRHGRWIELAMKGEFKCSVCGRGSKSGNTFQLIPTVYWNYCPNCGARMDGEIDE